MVSNEAECYLCNEDIIVLIKALASSTGPEKSNDPTPSVAVGCLFSGQVGYLLLVLLPVALPPEQARHKALPAFGHFDFLGLGLLGRGLLHARGRGDLSGQGRRLDVRKRL